uniref:Uncharacterized protein n=1 Tax=Anguilla anguilla TaxID=7936 RepID=A0A0E9S0V6_ANGAN
MSACIVLCLSIIAVDLSSNLKRHYVYFGFLRHFRMDVIKKKSYTRFSAL